MDNEKLVNKISKQLIEKLDDAFNVNVDSKWKESDSYISSAMKLRENGNIANDQWNVLCSNNEKLLKTSVEYDLKKRKDRVESIIELYQAGVIPEDEWERLLRNDMELKSELDDLESKGNVITSNTVKDFTNDSTVYSHIDGDFLKEEWLQDKGENKMNTTFEEIIEVVLAHEGGFVDDPDDRGGATNWGVTQAVWEDFLEDEFTSEDVRNFSREQAIELYREEFWKPSQAEKLPEEIREVYFDMCVNHGQRNAVKILQTAVNVKGGSLVVDGGIGPNTINASENLSLSDVQIERSGFYWNLVFVGSFYGKRNRQQKFIRGWIRRCFNLK